MIKPKARDMNRSRDVAGPELKRPYDKETAPMGNADDSKGTLQKFSLSDLHQGDHRSPLSALGGQSVVESSPMGSDAPDHKPVLAKGGLKDQSKGGGMREPKGLGRSVAKKMEYAAKAKLK